MPHANLRLRARARSTRSPASKGRHVFQPRMQGDRTAVTRERLAAELEAVHEAGGRFEVRR